MESGMARPRRRLVVGVLIVVGILVGTTTLWLGSKWKRALDNVEAMRVSSVTLPTPAPQRGMSETEPIGEQPLIPADPPDSNATPAPAEPPAELAPIPAPGAINILLLGTDARVGEDISRTDAMILVHLDGQSNHVSMLSFPRDLWVSLPG